MKEEIFDNILTNSKSHIIEYIIQIVIILAIVSGFGIYIGNLLFGTNSIEVLTNVQTQQSYLKQKLISLQKNNAKLQKEYFELKNLEPE